MISLPGLYADTSTLIKLRELVCMDGRHISSTSIHLLTIVKYGKSTTTSADSKQGTFFSLKKKPAGTASERYIGIPGDSIWDHKRSVWFGIGFGNTDRKKTELNVIKSCIFIRWQHWKTYMGKADTDVGFSSLCLLSSLKAACRVWLWSRYLKAAAEKHTHTHTWAPTATGVPVLDWCQANTQPSPQCQHKGLPGVFRWPLVLLHFLFLSTHPSSFLRQAQGQSGLWHQASPVPNPPKSSAMREL